MVTHHCLIPKGRFVIRTCGYVLCLKPEHLKLGDKDDLAEAIRRGKRKRRPGRLDRARSRRRWARKKALKKRRDREMRERALRVDAAASEE